VIFVRNVIRGEAMQDGRPSKRRWHHLMMMMMIKNKATSCYCIISDEPWPSGNIHSNEAW